MNIKDFLVGALCGAVAFAIIDRLHYEYERRSGTSEPEAAAADKAQEVRPNGSSPTTIPVPSSEPPLPEEEMGEAAADPDSETSGPSAANGEPRKDQLPDETSSAGAETGDEDTDSNGTTGSESAEVNPSLAQPDDATWGPYMEQTLRQFLAGHPSSPKFDLLSIGCSSGQCEIQAAGFDESTWPVWQQVMYDLRQQPWYEFGEAGSSAGRPPEYDGRFVLRTKLKRLPRQ